MVVSHSGETAVGQQHEVASQVRLVGKPEFGSQGRTIELTVAQLGKYMLEANDTTELLGREADSSSKLPLKLPPTEQGVFDQLLHANVARVALNGRHSSVEPGKLRLCAPCLAHMLFQRSNLRLKRTSLVQLCQQVIGAHFTQAIELMVSIGQAIGFGVNQAAQTRRPQAHAQIDSAWLRGKPSALRCCAKSQHLTPRLTEGKHELYAPVRQHLERGGRSRIDRIGAQPEAVNDAAQCG